MTRSKEEVIAEIVDQRRLLENLVLSYSGSIGKLDQEENSRRPPRNLRHPQDRPGLQYSRQEPIILETRGNRWGESGETKVPVGAGNAPFQQQTPQRRGRAGSVRTAFAYGGRSRADLDKEVEHTDTGDENASDYSDAKVNGPHPEMGDEYYPVEPQGHEQEMSLILSRDVPVLFPPNARPQNEHSTNRPASPKKTTVPRDAEMMPRKHDPNDTATFLYELIFGNRTSSNGAPPGNEMPPREGREPREPRERPAVKPHRQARETAEEESRRVTNNLLLKWTSMSRESVMETAEQAALPPSSTEDREWLKEMLAICAEIRAFEERDERPRGYRPYHEFETDDSRATPDMDPREHHVRMSDDTDYESRYYSRAHRPRYPRRHPGAHPTMGPSDARFRHPRYEPDPFGGPFEYPSEHPFIRFRGPYGPAVSNEGPAQIIHILTSALAEAQTQQRKAMRESGDSIKRMIMAVVDRYHGDEMDKFERLYELMAKNYEQQGKLLARPSVEKMRKKN
jgi:hypothetical protein